MNNEQQELDEMRKQIDAIDQQIQDLINNRASCALKVGEIKRTYHDNPVYYRPEREAQVLHKIMERNKGPLPDEDMARIFRNIMSMGLALQQNMRIAFLGPEGTFAHSAALKHFGPCIATNPMDAINQVFRVVESKNADYGVVPIENSTGGIVSQTLDLFIDSNIKVCGEVEIPIHQHLLNYPGDNTPITRIYSHQQSLTQCRQWLTENWPQVEQIAVSSNGKAAKLAKAEAGAAAIAGEMAADAHGLTKLAENIEDNPDNRTRFFIIGHQETPVSGKDKTTLLFKLDHQVGSLATLLNTLAKREINVLSLESRPSPSQSWHYLFFIDVEGHADDGKLHQTLKELDEIGIQIKQLGSYPKAVI